MHTEATSRAAGAEWAPWGEHLPGQTARASMRMIAWHRIGLVPLFASGLPPAAASGPADVVLTDARIYTADPGRTMAEALAVKGGEIVFVGRSSDARAFVGPSTRVKTLLGRREIPGLHDGHNHPLGLPHLE